MRPLDIILTYSVIVKRLDGRLSYKVPFDGPEQTSEPQHSLMLPAKSSHVPNYMMVLKEACSDSPDVGPEADWRDAELRLKSRRTTVKSQRG